MKVYIAGPMSGRPLWNWPAFDEAEAFLSDLGHEPVNPAAEDERRGVVEVTRAPGIGDVVAVQVPDTFDFRDAIRRDMRLIDDCDGIYLLDGWEHSVGARIEWAWATAHGKALMYQTPPPAETVLEEAQRLIGGDRNADYGHPADDMGRTAAMWNALWGTDLGPADVAMAMICIKLSREAHKPKRDNVVDLAGYAGCLAMVREQRQRVTF